MLIALNRRRYSEYTSKVIHWAACLPFVRNNSGKLIHRPRYAITYLKNDCIPEHFAIEYHCGQCCSDQPNSGKLEILSSPMSKEIVCHRCEEAAIQRGLPSSSEIVGSHVHVGRTKAVKDCCGGGV